MRAVSIAAALSFVGIAVAGTYVALAPHLPMSGRSPLMATVPVPMATAGAPAAKVAPPAADATASEPRSVRSIVVRPDGTIVNADSADARAFAPAAPSSTTVPAARAAVPNVAAAGSTINGDLVITPNASATTAPTAPRPATALALPKPDASVPAITPSLPVPGTERYPNATLNPVKRVAEMPVSTFSTDVDTASYANVRRFLQEGRLPPRDAVRVEELLNYFDYGYAAPTSADEPFRATVALTPSPWAPDREIIHIGLKGYDLAPREQPRLNLVFLVDTSGSMMPQDRLPLAQKTMNLIIDQLRPQDRVSLVAYAGTAGVVLNPTAGSEQARIRAAVDRLSAEGATAGGDGLALAYSLAEQNFAKGAVNRVVLMTDGDFNMGITDPELLKAFVAGKRATGIYLSVFGYGRGNYKDALMQALAQNGNGTAAYIDTLQEAWRIFRDDFAGGVFPIANDVKVQVEFNPALVAEYRLIGYETRALNREDFNNDRVDAGEVGSGMAVTALYEIKRTGSVPPVDPLRYQPQVVSVGTSDMTAGELAYLKIRYKLPGDARSQLMTRPITEGDRIDSDAAPQATRWALAVAAYGQVLRGDPYLASGFGWDRVLDLAQRARGEDPSGTRAEFVTLVRAAAAMRPPAAYSASGVPPYPLR
jgi:Ca-activated chloride channel family protein